MNWNQTIIIKVKLHFKVEKHDFDFLGEKKRKEIKTVLNIINY